MNGPGLRAIFTQLREDVACVAGRDPAARGKLEILLTYPGVHAIIHYRLANWLWRRGFRFAARFLSWSSRLATNIDIHPAATIGPRLFIDHGAGVVIGATAEIGADVTLYHGVTLGGVSWSEGKRHPTLEDGVLCGAGAQNPRADPDRQGRPHRRQFGRGRRGSARRDRRRHSRPHRARLGPAPHSGRRARRSRTSSDAGPGRRSPVLPDRPREFSRSSGCRKCDAARVRPAPARPSLGETFKQ